MNNCRTCKYRSGNHCRRFPPMTATNGGFPFVAPDETWCGEWADNDENVPNGTIGTFSRADGDLEPVHGVLGEAAGRRCFLGHLTGDYVGLAPGINGNVYDTFTPDRKDAD